MAINAPSPRPKVQLRNLIKLGSHSCQNNNPRSKKGGNLRLCYKYIQDYLDNSTLHGLRYIGDPNISFGERLCWLTCFIMAVLCAGYFVSLIYIKQDQTPVMITTNPIPVTISDIPFPGITVCGMNKVKRSVAKAILENGTEVEKSILSSYCENNLEINTTRETYNQASHWGNVLKFILKAAPSCQDIIKYCEWKSMAISCEKWFNPTLTDDGLCCTFNQMPSNYIFRKPDYYNILTHNYPAMVEDWSQESGYRKLAPMDTFPWRAEGAGLHFGLTLVLDAALHEYYCVTENSAGFKLLMHNPLETPTMSRTARMVMLNRESWYAIEVVIQEATDAIRSMPIHKRYCHFNNERYLQFFRQYTQANCMLECRTNYTMRMCGCVPYFLPRDESKPVCGFRDASCVVAARMQIAELHDEGICMCLPGCFELSFEKHGHFGMLHNSTIRNTIFKRMPINSTTESAVIIHHYFEGLLLTKSIKRELYSFAEFLSNTGGLLGLFLGCSVLSAVEVVYYLSLKLLCSVCRRRKEVREIEEVTIYPFVH